MYQVLCRPPGAGPGWPCSVAVCGPDSKGHQDLAPENRTQPRFLNCQVERIVLVLVGYNLNCYCACWCSFTVIYCYSTNKRALFFQYKCNLYAFSSFAYFHFQAEMERGRQGRGGAAYVPPWIQLPEPFALCPETRDVPQDGRDSIPGNGSKLMIRSM